MSRECRTGLFGVILGLLVAVAAPAQAAKMRPAAHDDPGYAMQLYRGLLGREPAPVELTRAIRDLGRAPHRILIRNLLLDSPEFAGRVDDRAFLAGVYSQLHGRSPLAHEWLIGLHFLGEGVPRSEVLGNLVRAAEPSDDSVDASILDFTRRSLRSYRRAARAFARLGEDRLQARLDDEVARIDRVEPAPPPLPTVAPSGTEPIYNVYYGYLHAHTRISFDAALEGSEGPFEAFAYARDVAGLDYLGLSDHAEFISTRPWNNEWRELERAVDRYNEDGTFVALRGFEYSNPLYGHINVFNTSSFKSAWGALTLHRFYAWLAQRPEAASTFNHPGEWDLLGREFLHFAPSPAVTEQMVGIELLTHDAEYGQYSVGYRAGDGLGYLDEANQAGWRVASVSAQDNHAGEWGTRDEYRTGVLALTLTREEILDAVRHRRFFSTQDRNLRLSFRAEGREMGSRLGPGAKTFVVRVDDADGEGMTAIDLYGGGLLVEHRPLAGVGEASFSIATPPRDTYFYVLVTQQDGDQAMSAPIWVEGVD